MSGFSLACLFLFFQSASAGFSVLSRCSSWEAVIDTYSVTGSVALSTDVGQDSYLQHYDVNQTSNQTTVIGNSKLEMSVNITYRNATLPSNVRLVAHLRAAVCSATPPGGSIYLQKLNQSDDSLPYASKFRRPNGTAVNTISLIWPNFASSTVPWLVDYDRALSVVLVEANETDGYSPSSAGGRFACCNLIPNLPTLPETYSATVEANFGLSKAYTLVHTEYRSKARNAVTIVSHTHLQRQVQIHDYTANVTVTLIENNTYPHGFCTKGPIEVRGLGLVANGSLPSIASYLQFGDAFPVTFDGVNKMGVRGIDCESWSRPNFKMGPITGNLKYYFPVTEWKNAHESYHRLLKRIELNGFNPLGHDHSPDPHNFSHTYDFINMAPAVSNEDVFNPCLVLQMGPLGSPRALGSVTGCGCDTSTTAASVDTSSMYTYSDMVALGVILPLLTLALGIVMGLYLLPRCGKGFAPLSLGRQQVLASDEFHDEK